MLDFQLSFSLIDMRNIQTLQTLEQLKLLADPRRMRILRLLLVEPASLTRLARILKRSPAWVRHHLLVLEAAGLVELVEVRTTGKVTEKFYRAKAGAFMLRQLVLPETKKPAILFSGSDDLALEGIAGHLEKRVTMFNLPVGSLDGLVNLRQGLCQISGSHLLDESGEYNMPFIRHLFPDRSVEVITLAHRTQGWMLAPGNPKRLRGIQDLARQDVHFVNRNPGSGTRLWIDTRLRELGIPPHQIPGYAHEVKTHSEAAALIQAGRADIALGLQAAANEHGLDFIPGFEERYDLVLLPEHEKSLLPLLEYIQTKDFRNMLSALTGYNPSHTGQQIYL
jgi:putative molybdopterin biosynthesis protein